MNREGIDQLAINEAQTDLKNRQISAIIAVNQGSASFVDCTSAGGNRPNIEQDHRQGQAGQTISVMQHGTFQIKPVPFQVTKHFFNGLITNDKFCMMRTGQLQLNHWRRPMRLRTSTTEKVEYSASDESECGGSHETPLENSPGSARIPERTEPMGSSLSFSTGDNSRCRNKTDANGQTGGATCE